MRLQVVLLWVAYNCSVAHSTKHVTTPYVLAHCTVGTWPLVQRRISSKLKVLHTKKWRISRILDCGDHHFNAVSVGGLAPEVGSPEYTCSMPTVAATQSTPMMVCKTRCLDKPYLVSIIDAPLKARQRANHEDTKRKTTCRQADKAHLLCDGGDGRIWVGRQLTDHVVSRLRDKRTQDTCKHSVPLDSAQVDT
jgi:hypothetical protein